MRIGLAGEKRVTHFASRRETFVARSISRKWDELGQMVQRVVEVIGGKGGNIGPVLAHLLGYRRPIVREPDLGLERHRLVVAPSI
jgi:hypothetical protein